MAAMAALAATVGRLMEARLMVALAATASA